MTVPRESREPILLSLFLAELFYFVAMMLVNLSVLALYWRTFGVARFATPALGTTGVVVIVWSIVSVS